MNINSNELSILKKIKFAAEPTEKSNTSVALKLRDNENQNPEATTSLSETPETTEASMNKLMFQGLKNVVSDPQLAQETGALNNVETQPKEEGSEKEYVAPFKSNLAFQGRAGKFKSVALSALLGFAALAPVATLTSCSGEDVTQTVTQDVKVEIDMSVFESILKEIQNMRDDMAKRDEVNAKRFDLITKMMQQMIDLQKEQNLTDKTFYTLVTQNQDAMKEILVANGMKQDEANAVINEILQEIKDGKLTGEEALQKIISILGDINAQLTSVIEQMKEHFKDDKEILSYLDTIAKNSEENNELQKENRDILLSLKALMEKQGAAADKFAKEVLNYIAAVGFEMNRNFGIVIDKIGNDTAKLDEVVSILQEINGNIKQNGEDGKILGNQILNYIAAFGFETNQNFKKILGAINAQTAGSAEIKNMLQKVLDKLDTIDKNQQDEAKAIIDAIGKLEISGGNIDLTSVEEMLKELLEISKGNNELLSSIDIKMDAFNITAKSIEAKLDKEFGKNDARYTNIMNVLNAIKNQAGNGIDADKLFAKLDNLASKLDDILAAIKDHKITVDVTGKVTCECDCGNHEGILGDLDKILGE